MSVVIRTVLAYIVFTHYNSLFTFTAIIKCISDSELLRSYLAHMRAAAPPLV